MFHVSYIPNLMPYILHSRVVSDCLDQRPLSFNFSFAYFHNSMTSSSLNWSLKRAFVECQGFEPGVAGRKSQTNQLSQTMIILDLNQFNFLKSPKGTLQNISMLLIFFGQSYVSDASDPIVWRCFFKPINGQLCSTTIGINMLDLKNQKTRSRFKDTRA